MKTNKGQLKIFFMVAFGMPVVLGIFMAMGFYRGGDVSTFPIVWMYLPAAGVMAGALYAQRQKADTDSAEQDTVRLPKVFYVTFLVTTLLLALMAVAGVFDPSVNPAVIMNNGVILSSLICLIELIAMGKAKREAYGLTLTKNLGKSLLGALLFVLIYLIQTIGVTLLIYLFTGEGMETLTFNPQAGMWLGLILPLNLVLSFLPFLGEEYGWRYYLQPVFQEKFGLRRGVILAGLLWGIWHLPINLFYYSPQTGFQSILVQLAGCVGMGIFFGWVYMRTQNVWAVTLIHFLNNNLGLALFGVSAAGIERNWGDTLLAIVTYLVLYLPFLAMKEYRRK